MEFVLQSRHLVRFIAFQGPFKLDFQRRALRRNNKFALSESPQAVSERLEKAASSPRNSRAWMSSAPLRRSFSKATAFSRENG